MGIVLALLRTIGPVVLQSAETGTLLEIAETAARLLALLRPLLSDPKGRQALDDLHAVVVETTGIRPAQPEDPVFAHQSQSRTGGR